MPEKALVTLKYGPYMNCSGLVQHRLSRLEGLRVINIGRHDYSPVSVTTMAPSTDTVEKKISIAVLASDGHSVVLEEISDWNAVELVVNGETVFQCNIKELDFGGDGLLDPLCEDARQAVLRAY